MGDESSREGARDDPEPVEGSMNNPVPELDVDEGPEQSAAIGMPGFRPLSRNAPVIPHMEVLRLRMAFARDGRYGVRISALSIKMWAGCGSRPLLELLTYHSVHPPEYLV